MDDASKTSPVTEVLIADAHAGNERALDALVERYLPEIRAYVRLNLRASVRDKESCSDLVQTVCKDVLCNLGQFEYRGENSFKAWLYIAVVNKIRTRERYYRAQRRSAKREVPHGAHALSKVYGTICSPSRHASAREELERVERAFDVLPADYREVLTLSRVAGLSLAETAAQMERSTGSVKMLLSRAVARLVSVLDDTTTENHPTA